jgi:hypothetical protein
VETSLKAAGKTIEPTPLNSDNFYNVFYKIGIEKSPRFMRLMALKKLFFNVIVDIMQTQEDDDQKSYQTKIKNAVDIKTIEQEIEALDKEFFSNAELLRNVSELGMKQSFMPKGVHEIFNEIMESRESKKI